MSAKSYPDIELAVIASAISGDSGRLYSLAGDLMDRGVPFDVVLFDYLMAAERSVGERWARGDYLVAEEHAVTGTIETVIALLTGMFDQPADAPLVVVATAEDDDHSLPARAIAAHLVYLGYRTTFLGTGLPAEDLREFLDVETPTAMVLSATMTSHLPGARAVIAAAHQAGVPVVVGGKAFGHDGRWARVVGADAHAAGLADAAAVIERWVEDGAPELTEPEEVPAALTDLMSERARIIAKAEAALATDSRFRQQVSVLLGALEGAILSGDADVLGDTISWQRQLLAARGFEGNEIVNAVAAVLEDHSEEAARLLATARNS